MMLPKGLSLAVFLLLASVFQVWAQPSCTSHLLPNTTVDIDQYNNTGLRVIQSMLSSGSAGMADCSLSCCEAENCSLVIFTEDENANCLLIQCISDEACNPIPSDTSQCIRSIRNNVTESVNNSVYVTNAGGNASAASNPTDIAGNATLNTPSINPTTTPNISSANASVSENVTKSSLGLELMGSSSNTTEMLASNDTAASSSDNTTGLNASDTATSPDSSNVTSLNESFEESDNGTGSNNTKQLGESVTESVLLPTDGDNTTSELANGTGSVPPMNSSQTTDLPTAIIIGSNSTLQNSTNGTLPFSEDGKGSDNNTAAAQEEDSSEDGAAPVASNQSMMVILIATLSVGMLLFIAIIGVVSKKAVDGWQRRHYSRIDYLVNGMYN